MRFFKIYKNDSPFIATYIVYDITTTSDGKIWFLIHDPTMPPTAQWRWVNAQDYSPCDTY